MPKAHHARMSEQHTERVNLTMPKSLAEAIDEWRRTQRDLPARTEAIRRLVMRGLNARKDVTHEA